MEESHSKPHAIMLPLPYQGHVTPSIHLAIKLASKGFTITFVNTQIIHHDITKSQPNITAVDGDDIFAEARKSGLDIRYKTVSDGFPLDFNRRLNHSQFIELNFLAIPVHVDELVGDLVKNDPSISCLITDSFYTWATKIAHKYNLVNISFWTESALALNLHYHLDLLITKGHFPPHDNCDGPIDYIPGIQAIEPKDLMSFPQGTHPMSITVRRLIEMALEDVKTSDFVLCNTILELEFNSITVLQEKQLPLYPIGPILPSGLTRPIVPTSLKAQSNCTQWLNNKPHGSVLYVSFGSFALPGKFDIEEIAHGLLLSKVEHFIWVIRANEIMGCDQNDILPVGFRDEINGRGLIVTWANQIEILSHHALGGFLTHCGWNSTLEGFWCGVPLLCFPLGSDQPTNRKLVVDDWRIGVNLCDEKPLTRFEVAEKVNLLMSGKSAAKLRNETMNVKKIVRDAVAIENGSGSSVIISCLIVCLGNKNFARHEKFISSSKGT